MSAVGQVEVPEKLRQSRPPLKSTDKVLVTGQFLTGTSGCSQWTLLRSNSEGLGSIVLAVVDVAEVVVVVGVSEVVVVVLVSAVDVVLALSSTTPDEDLLALQSNGQHQPSEQPLSGSAIASNTPILASIFIQLKE